MRWCANDADDAIAAKCELAGDVLRSFGRLRFAATGWSMLPSVWPGDTLLVDRVCPDQLAVGDIALVGRDGGLCAHRVVRLPANSGNRCWITQGDAMPEPDRAVSEGDLLGRVTKIIRSGKCLSVSANMSLKERLLAQIIRRSVFAARVFVYMIGEGRTQGQTQGQTQRESIFPC